MSPAAMCDYCGLPVSGSARTQQPVYCCHGCRFAAGICSPSLDAGQLLGPAGALGLSVFFTMNVVMMTMALWSYADKSQSDFEVALRHFLRYGAMTFSLPVLLLLGRPLLSHAISGLRQGVFTTDLLLSTGVAAAYAVSIVNTLLGSGHVYYEVGCVILVLVTLGRWLEAEGRSRASAALDGLERLLPATVRRITSSGEEDWPRAQLVVGETIRVIAGERIPVDGQLVRGHAVVDEQFFTGESVPTEKCPGDSLLGGTLNLDGDLILTVSAPPQAGALGRLVEAVRTAQLCKGRYQRLSDLWSRWFFPIVSVIAIGAFAVHGVRSGWESGLLTAMSVILIACPCALALATPLAVWTALGTLASKGILCRSGATLEKLAGLRAVRWDKTGTLTTGTPRVERFLCEATADRSQTMTLAGLLTAASGHAYSRAIANFVAEEQGGDPSTAEPFGIDQNCTVKTFAGRGLRMVIEAGDVVALGSLRWMAENQMDWGTDLTTVVRGDSDQPMREAVEHDSGSAAAVPSAPAGNAKSPPETTKPLVAIGRNGHVLGLFLLDETIRPAAAGVVQQLDRLGLNQMILTGDRAARAREFAHELGLAAESELLPEQKLAAIQQARHEYGIVAMIGDGLNDAPALAAADIGIALGCGADVSRESADVCLLSSDLTLVPWMYEYSQRAVRVIRSNLAWSFGYNSLGVLVAATGELHPALAAALMVISSVMVLGNSLRLSLAIEEPVSIPSGTEDSARVEKRPIQALPSEGTA